MEEKTIKKAFPRKQMLDLLSIDQNNLVLYDLLREKNFTQFCNLLRQGYRLNAFILNCMIDNGFEKKISLALEISQKPEAKDVYDFLLLYFGDEKAKDFVVRHGWNSYFQYFSDDDLLSYELWDAIVEQKRYHLLLKLGRLDLMKKALNAPTSSFMWFLVEQDAAEYLVSLGCINVLSNCSAGRERLWKDKNWREVLGWERDVILLVSGLENLCEVYDFILDNGGLDDLYRCYKSKTNRHEQIEQYLFKKGITRPFVEDKQWYILFKYGYYHLIDLEKWWASCWGSETAHDYIKKCAVKQKNWDFLEAKGCLKTLFRHFRWMRWYRALCSSKA